MRVNRLDREPHSTNNFLSLPKPKAVAQSDTQGHEVHDGSMSSSRMQRTDVGLAFKGAVFDSVEEEKETFFVQAIR